MFLIPRALRSLVLTLLLPMVLLGGCATTNPRDPLEPMNRAVYSFNDTLDGVLFRPLAEGYRTVVPSFMRTGISNFFSNINDILIALNNLLQGKVGAAVSDIGRVMINTTAGIGGLFDVASNLGLEKHNEDFGQTLGRWGIGDGPYLVLPILGPSNFRDALGRVVDAKGDPIGYMHDVPWRNSLWGTRQVNQRAELLDTSKILETAALDPYEFLRDAYLQRRRNLIFDGSPPREKDEDADAPKPAAPPRAESPFPRSVEDDRLLTGTPLASGAETAATPARASSTEAPATATVAPSAAQQPTTQTAPQAPRVEVILPSEPTGAGAAAPQASPQNIVRVWPAIAP